MDDRNPSIFAAYASNSLLAIRSASANSVSLTSGTRFRTPSLPDGILAACRALRAALRDALTSVASAFCISERTPTASSSTKVCPRLTFCPSVTCTVRTIDVSTAWIVLVLESETTFPLAVATISSFPTAAHNRRIRKRATVIRMTRWGTGEAGLSVSSNTAGWKANSSRVRSIDLLFSRSAQAAFVALQYFAARSRAAEISCLMIIPAEGGEGA